MKKLVLFIMLIFISYVGYEFYIDQNTFVVTTYNIETNEEDLIRKNYYTNFWFAW